MYISHETQQQTDTRLRGVMRLCTLKAYPDSYAFVEQPLMPGSTPTVQVDALALVRDDASWSQLVPCSDATEELFGLFRFHFPASVDNSGFVGWLASLLKAELGVGVFVVCGQNSADGGIYDYWGCPLEARADVLRIVQSLATS